MSVPENIMISTLIGAMKDAHRAVIRANRAEEPDQRNTHLFYLGSNLILMGEISVAVTMIALVWPPEKIGAYPTFMYVILSFVLDFILVSALAGITVGIFLLAFNNPGQYIRLAMVTLWISDVAAAFAMGILLVSYFSPS